MAEKQIREYIVRQTGELKAGLYENAPTTAIIVEEIQDLIRCRDCKWHEWYIRSRLMDGREYESNECRKFNMAVIPDWFCADGERREECGE